MTHPPVNGLMLNHAEIILVFCRLKACERILNPPETALLGRLEQFLYDHSSIEELEHLVKLACTETAHE